MPWLPWCHAGYSVEESRAWIASQLTAFRDGTEYSFAIVDPQGNLLGGCGLNRIDRPNLGANLGYWVRTAEGRRGVATAAVKLLVSWVFSNTDLHRLEVLVAIENRASQRVAEKAGAVREGLLRKRLQLRGRMHDAVVFSIVRNTRNL